MATFKTQFLTNLVYPQGVEILSGKAENVPYSLSRWTDLPAAKWPWFKQQLEQGWMVAFDQRTSVPAKWSLKPDDTLGLIFWTKNPDNLLANQELLKPYRVKVHVTVTGWSTVEKGAPGIYSGADKLYRAARVFGPENVIWRFSPVPILHDVVDRFRAIAAMASDAGLDKVYCSFLQDNDFMRDERKPSERIHLLRDFASEASFYKIRVRLCNEDRNLLAQPVHPNLELGVCAPPEDFGPAPTRDACGCGYAVDPFTINETCVYGCRYCLAPETPVLFGDFVWRPLSEVKVGDVLLGIDETPPGLWRPRKYRKTVVEAVWASNKPTMRIVTERGEVTTTADHLWLAGATRRWRRTDLLDLQTDMYRLDDVTPELPFNEAYQLGYIKGITWGDGTFRYIPGQPYDRNFQTYWRVALADEEPLIRLRDYLVNFGIDVSIRPFDGGSAYGCPNPRPMQKVETRSQAHLAKLYGMLERDLEDTDFYRGFLAGIFDAEGSYNRNLRISQFKRPEILFEVVSRYGRALGLSFVHEHYPSGSGSSRLKGMLRDRIRFFSLVRPAISRKADHIIGRSVDCLPDPIQRLEKGPVQTMIDIQTSTHTFFAAGFVSHNCYAGNKESAPKKRNTTRHLPLFKP